MKQKLYNINYRIKQIKKHRKLDEVMKVRLAELYALQWTEEHKIEKENKK